MTRHAAAIVLTLGTALPSAPVWADPVVVELFTSQGCAACPPADQMMAELAAREDVLPLALHVDYWDYIGWADTFALPLFTLRQKRYAHAAGRSMIYTPQIIVDGTWDIAGFKPMKVADAIDRAAAVPDRVGIELSPAGGELAIRLTPVAPVAGGGQVILARFLPHEQVTIESGENAGRVLTKIKTPPMTVPNARNSNSSLPKSVRGAITCGRRLQQTCSPRPIPFAAVRALPDPPRSWPAGD